MANKTNLLKYILMFLSGAALVFLYGVTQVYVTFNIPSRLTNENLVYTSVTCSPFQNGLEDCEQNAKTASRNLVSDILTYKNSFYCEPGFVLRQKQREPINSCAGATALCCDGTCSYSQNRSGTCSHHGGVCQWSP